MFNFSWHVIVFFWVVTLCSQGVPEDGGPLFHPHLRPNRVTTHNPHVLLPEAEITLVYMHHKGKGFFPDSLLLLVWLTKDGVPDIATAMRSTSKWKISCGVLCFKIWLLFVVYLDPWQICAYGPVFFVYKRIICRLKYLCKIMRNTDFWAWRHNLRSCKIHRADWNCSLCLNSGTVQ